MRRAAGLVLLLLSAAASAGAGDVEVSIVEEAYIEDVPVSGRPRAGVMEHVPGARPEAGVLWLRLPERDGDGQQRLCVEVRSRDGRYLLRLDATLDPAQGPGPVRIAGYELEHPQAFDDADTDDLAALAWLGGHCDRPGDVIVPVAWGQPVSPIRLQIFVNAARLHAEVLVPREEDPSPEVIRCEKLRGGQNTAFDSRCELELTQLPHDAQLDRARLIRKRGPNRAEPLALPILLARP